MKSDDLLNKAFGITPKTIEPTEIIESESKREREDNSDVDSDYEETRKNIKDILEKGNTAITSALDLVKGTEHPRAIEAFSVLIKSVADINAQLLDLQLKMKKIKNENTSKEVKGTGSKNTMVFVGSTAELNAYIKKCNETSEDE